MVTLKEIGLTDAEIRSLEGAIGAVGDRLEKTSATGWAHAMYLAAGRQTAKSFDPDGDYDYYGLFNLRSLVPEYLSGIRSKISSALYEMENKSRLRKRWLEGEDVDVR